MDRRAFLKSSAALAAGGIEASVGFAAAPPGADYRRLLILVELKGGNDGLNTLVPYSDTAYYALRPKIGIGRDQVVPLSDHAGLHPALAPLADLWKERRLAVLQGVGYPDPNLSHFRSIEIWETASKSTEYLPDGWLTRAFAAQPPPRAFAADGVIVGSNELGPLAGGGTRAVALADTEQFLRRARLANARPEARSKAVAHILKVEANLAQAAAQLATYPAFKTQFPSGNFGKVIRTACQVIANPASVAAVRVTLAGFDTHVNQPATHGRLLAELANGITALKSALEERRVRSPPPRESLQRDRSWYGERALCAGRPGRGRVLRRCARPHAVNCGRQPAIGGRFPQRVRNDSRALVERRFARCARRAIRGGAIPDDLMRRVIHAPHPTPPETLASAVRPTPRCARVRTRFRSSTRRRTVRRASGEIAGRQDTCS